MSEVTLARGRFVELVSGRDEELTHLYAMRPAEPRTPHAGWRPHSGPVPAFYETDGPLGPLLVRDARTRQPYGVVDGRVLRWSAVLGLTVFLDPRVSPPGAGVEAYVLYARTALARGVEGLQISVLGGDDIAHRMLHRLGLSPQATLRRESWSGGRFHDGVVYVIDADSIDDLETRLASLLYGDRG